MKDSTKLPMKFLGRSKIMSNAGDVGEIPLNPPSRKGENIEHSTSNVERGSWDSTKLPMKFLGRGEVRDEVLGS